MVHLADQGQAWLIGSRVKSRPYVHGSCRAEHLGREVVEVHAELVGVVEGAKDSRNIKCLRTAAVQADQCLNLRQRSHSLSAG